MPRPLPERARRQRETLALRHPTQTGDAGTEPAPHAPGMLTTIAMKQARAASRPELLPLRCRGEPGVEIAHFSDWCPSRRAREHR